MAEGWDIQGFFDGTPGGRASWSTGVADTGQALDYLRKAMADDDADAILIRRGPQVEDGALLIGPYLLLPTAAGERLARHLYELWRGALTRHMPPWDLQDDKVRQSWRHDALQLLTKLAAREDER